MSGMRRARFLLFLCIGLALEAGALWATDTSTVLGQIAALSVTAAKTTLAPGESVQLTVQGVFADGSTRDLTSDPATLYQSSASEAVSVSSSGLAQGIAVGESVVAVQYGDVSSVAAASVTLTVRAVGDRDGDGLPDDYETQYQLDPDFGGDAESDIDQDGLSNLQEHQAGTHPLQADTDGDTRPDGLEIAQGTDPRAADPGEEPPASPLDESCVISALNRTTRVQSDGVWVLPNVPANTGPVRVRATCVENGVTRAGQSDFFAVPVNGAVEVADIVFDDPEPVPAAMALTSASTQLTSTGQTAQLSAIVQLPGGSTRDVSLGTAGTSYISSNPAIVSVTADGLVTAVSSGVAIVSAANEGALGVLRFQVVLGGDTDGDGLPDDFELANGLDPNNPLDVLDDPDLDGLSTQDEFQLGLKPFDSDSDDDRLLDGREGEIGTNPLLADTDTDKISDGLEVLAGSNPLDPNSINVAPILETLMARPALFTLIFNTALGEASRRLEVTGRLIDGTEIDLRSQKYGTTYSSSDLTIASFGVEDGVVFAGQEGTATVTVALGSRAAPVQVTVQTFSPTALAFLQLPGFANGVDVNGDYAYVAAGNAGLHVVDVSDLEAPVLQGTVNTPGNANDVRVEDDLAYIADGANGLQIVDVSNPAAPVLLGERDTPGTATDLVVRGNLVYVADGSAGLRVIDASNPAAPVIVGFLETPGNARGIDEVDGLVVVADGTGGVHVINVANPASPVLLGSTHTRPNSASRAADVAVRGRMAYVADGSDSALGGLRVIDFRNPANPVLVGSTSNQFGLSSVALDDRLALTADYYYPNAVPIFDIGGAPLFTAVLNFAGAPSFRDDDGNGIAVRNGVVFLAAARGITDNGTWGDGGLHIGRAHILGDELGVAPQVSITAPLAGASVPERNVITLKAAATDDVLVASVQFLVDGVVVAQDFKAPFQATYTVPKGVASLTIGAVATDLGGNQGTAPNVVVNVIPDNKPVVVLTAPVAGARVVEGTAITLAADATDDVQITKVDFFVNGTLRRTVTVPPYRYDFTVPVNTTQVSIVAVATDSAGQTAATPALVLPVEDDLAPVVTVLQPLDGAEVIANSRVKIVVGASDDGVVQRVRFLVNGALLGEDFVAPFESEVRGPANGSTMTLSAIAEDNLLQQTQVNIQIVGIPDPGTTVTGTVLMPDGSPAAGASVVAATRSATTGADGRFTLADVPTVDPIRVRATLQLANGFLVGYSTEGNAVVGGLTEVGEIHLLPGFPNGNGGFETGNFTGYTTTGQATVIPQLGTVLPTEGQFMALITTGGIAVNGVRSTVNTTFAVPSGATFGAFDFNVLSDEFPGFVGSIYNDTLRVRLTTPDGNQDVVIASVNGSSFFESLSTGYNGMTGFATVRLDVSKFAGQPGLTNLVIDILVTDVGDGAVDSAALVDNFRFE
jgi:uncharacterized protein YjdB